MEYGELEEGDSIIDTFHFIYDIEDCGSARHGGRRHDVRHRRALRAALHRPGDRPPRPGAGRRGRHGAGGLRFAGPGPVRKRGQVIAAAVARFGGGHIRGPARRRPP